MGLLQDLRRDAGRYGKRKRFGLGRLVLMYGQYPGFRAGVRWRLSGLLYNKGPLGRVVAKLLWGRNVNQLGCYLSPLAEVGGGLYLPHPVGVVVGDGVVMGKDLLLYQHTTLGAKNMTDTAYPRVGDGVVIYAGAVLVGGITVGDGAVVGALALVAGDVGAGSMVVGTRAMVKSNKSSGKKS